MTRGSPSIGRASDVRPLWNLHVARKESYDITGSVKGAPSALRQKTLLLGPCF